MRTPLTDSLPRALAGVLLLLGLGSCGDPAAVRASAGADDFRLPADPANYAPLKKYSPMEIPAHNPLTVAKAKLGWHLFFDPRLSGDGKKACYSCHLNDRGLSDGVALNQGAFDKPLTRNTPTLWNVGFLREWYWDGRAKTLEAQALAAWKGANMGASEPEKVVAALNEIAPYRTLFTAAFGEPATVDNVAQALASYMRTIISQTTPYDAWKAGDEKAVSDAVKRGEIAFQKAKCDNCHSGKLLTDQLFHNVGIGMDQESFDVGRFKVSNEEKDKGAFKTPTLRDVAESAPYFHDGSVATLEEAVQFMVGGGRENPYLDRANLQKADLSEAEIADLIEFLKSLTETTELEPPALPGA